MIYSCVGDLESDIGHLIEDSLDFPHANVLNGILVLTLLLKRCVLMAPSHSVKLNGDLACSIDS